jgi:aryl-alcohol dehydrogenase-like predicted oxidoreductase
MQLRTIGPFAVTPLGLGCMSLSHAYGTAPDEASAAALLHRALDLGCNFLDTAALYGFGANETLIGKVLKSRRHEFVLASKCGMFRNAAGVREIDGSPATIKRTCEDSLTRLQTDVIDLYYLHRWDKKVPIEDSVGALADLVTAGKIRTIGLSEVSADTLRRAHAVHPITALQTEYSLWTRNPEIAVLEACRSLGIGFVAFSPLARGFLSGRLRDMQTLEPKDIRHAMPRFQGENFAANVRLLDGLQTIAAEAGCTASQLALAWVLAQGEHIVPIPGTTSIAHLEENWGAIEVELSLEILAKLDALINAKTVAGPRYNAVNQSEVDTEET